MRAFRRGAWNATIRGGGSAGSWGRLTDSKRQYYFRTIKPISYIRDGRFTKTMRVQIEVDSDESSAR